MQEVAENLSNALEALEGAKDALIAAPKDEKVPAFKEYMAARAASSPAFAEAQNAVDLEAAGVSTPGTPPAETEAPAETPVETPEEQPAAGGPREPEAAPGVPLVPAPGSPVTAGNIHAYGPVVAYQTKGDDAGPTVNATPYAFDGGTVVVTSEGEVALEQPSRLIVSDDDLGIVTQDVFADTYEDAVPREAASPETAPEAPSEPTA